MILILVCAGIVLWVFYMAARFYRSTNWDEPANMKEMRKMPDRRRTRRRRN